MKKCTYNIKIIVHNRIHHWQHKCVNVYHLDLQGRVGEPLIIIAQQPFMKHKLQEKNYNLEANNNSVIKVSNVLYLLKQNVLTVNVKIIISICT